ncbi:MAG: serine hydrolase domain-containing protein [Bacteroidota bacterium]
MKRKSLYLIPSLVMLICFYFSFEPVLIHNVGWKDFISREIPAIQKTSDVDTFYARAIDKSEQILQDAFTELPAPAISVAVGIDNKVVWARALGSKDIDRQEKADVNTSFRIGSTSKTITSVILGRLMEKRMLDLDKPVQQYVPYLGGLQEPITLRQLVSHSSGVREYETCLCFPIWEYFSNDRHETIRESIDMFQHDPLLFKPGTQFFYSSYNFTLLSAAMEETTKKNFLDIAHEEVFIPLQMENTSGDYADSTIENRATFYEVLRGKYKKAYSVDNSNKWAGGGFISTPTDLVKMGNAVLHYSILNKATVDSLFTPQRLADGSINEQHYALGWRVNKKKKMFDGEKEVYVVHHGGTAMGSTSFLVLFPDYKISLSLLMNRMKPENFEDFSRYAFKIAEAFIEELEKQDSSY